MSDNFANNPENSSFKEQIFNDPDDPEILEDIQKYSQNAVIIADDNIPDSFLKQYKNTALSRGIHEAQVYNFISSVFLDNERKENDKLGLKELFISWCKNGNHTWLSPVHGSCGLKVLDEILRTHIGKRESLRPFIKLLTKLSKNNISPYSFAAYVMYPRMSNDYNWRKWEEKHLEALTIIADLLIKMNNESPFDNEILGNKSIKLAKDVILPKYIGKPLSLFSEEDLNKKNELKSYQEAWKKIKFNKTLGIYWMRRNILNFIYIMSGKIDLVQLTLLIKQLPYIENEFRDHYNSHTNTIGSESSMIDNLSLYDINIHYSIDIRKNKGYKNYDYIVEMKAYLKILEKLLNKTTGIYLAGYFAKIISKIKDPSQSEKIAELAGLLNDQGGMHVYKWHTSKFLKVNKNEQDSYLTLLNNNGGVDPEYPKINEIFNLDDTDFENNIIDQLASQLGLDLNNITTNSENIDHNDLVLQNIRFIKRKNHFSFKDILKAYIEKNPESEKIIRNFSDDIIKNGDREWDIAKINEIDSLNLHAPLLRLIIRGIGQNFIIGLKSSSFKELFEKYGSVNSQMYPKISNTFSIALTEITEGNTIDEKIKSRIKLDIIKNIFEIITDTGAVNINETVKFLNELDMNLTEPIKKLKDSINEVKSMIAEAEKNEKIGNEGNIQKIEKLKKDISKKEKSLIIMENNKKNYKNILDNYDFFNNDEKFIITIITGSFINKINSDFKKYIIKLIVQRYNNVKSVTDRLEYLKDDITADILTYNQFLMIINLLEVLFNNINSDSDIKEILNKAKKTFAEIIKPYIQTSDRVLSFDAIDAGCRKITNYNNLNAERSKWQEILQNKKNTIPQNTLNLTLSLSKSFIDAYYGDMGGICLSAFPDLILKQQVFNIRLIDTLKKEIIGMGLIAFSNKPSNSLNKRRFFYAFSINPLRSILMHLNKSQMIFLYLQYRVIFETISKMLNMPIVIPGIKTFGIISNTADFANIIKTIEFQKGAKIINDAYGFSVYYDQDIFANALLIIDPPSPNTFWAENAIKKLTK